MAIGDTFHDHRWCNTTISDLSARVAKAEVQLARAEKVIEAAREWLRIGDKFGPAAHHKLATAVAEYDRPSAPLDGTNEAK